MVLCTSSNVELISVLGFKTIVHLRHRTTFQFLWPSSLTFQRVPGIPTFMIFFVHSSRLRPHLAMAWIGIAYISSRF